jgi:hypothetical protein
VDFIDHDSGLYAVEGLAHITLLEGHLIKLVHDSLGIWGAEEVLDLGDAPYAATLGPDGTPFIVTSRRLLALSFPIELSVIIDSAFWSCLYPNSVVVSPDSVVYIGMRAGVAAIDLKDSTREIEWLQPR